MVAIVVVITATHIDSDQRLEGTVSTPQCSCRNQRIDLHQSDMVGA